RYRHDQLPALSSAGKERSFARALRSFAKAFAAPIYSRQQQFITVKRFDAPDVEAVSDGCRPDRATQCSILDSVKAFGAIAPEFPASFRDSVGELRRRVAEGCVLCIARRRREDGAGHRVVGYELAQRGIFSALGRRHGTAMDIVFSHYAEVLPSF